MRKTILISLILAAVAFAAAALAASSGATSEAKKAAAKVTVRDGVRETRALRKNGRVDIVKVIAAHHGPDLQFTVVVRSKINPARHAEQPLLGINTRGNPASDPEYLVRGGAVFKNPKKGKPERIAHATLTEEGRSWQYRFSPKAVPGGLGKFGWAAFTVTKKALDVVPNNSYVTFHG